MRLPRPEPHPAPHPKPVVASVEMGYGHLRAAHAIAEVLDADILHVDRPPRLTFTVGGAGAQADLARDLLKGVRTLIEEDRLRLSLVAGARPGIAAKFHQWTRDAGLEDHLGQGIDIFLASGLEDYFGCRSSGCTR